ncbi:hypothetical protein [Mycoplasma sp. E35C]|uniref:hypothetical protein n=1 Tax=Mycoplasma sp. E35C TaxID=2801918 RepID=UPI001CA42A17|nr:hypothetical protein [Mycoplasma sp. E35C]QZX49473.1 hypothetical protein JJE79_01870 [Mycoplasma sp. E35C]
MKNKIIKGSQPEWFNDQNNLKKIFHKLTKMFWIQVIPIILIAIGIGLFIGLFSQNGYIYFIVFIALSLIFNIASTIITYKWLWWYFKKYDRKMIYFAIIVTPFTFLFYFMALFFFINAVKIRILFIIELLNLVMDRNKDEMQVPDLFPDKWQEIDMLISTLYSQQY